MFVVREEPVTRPTKKMSEMQPGEIARIVDPNWGYAGTLVMRTLSTGKFEVMNLSKPKAGECWTNKEDAPLKVAPLRPGERVILEVI